MLSNGYRPLTSLVLYFGPQQHSLLQLGAHVSGQEPGHDCAAIGRGEDDEGAGGGTGGGRGGAIFVGGEQQVGVHCGAHVAGQAAGHVKTGVGEGGSRIIMGGGSACGCDSGWVTAQH